jgi:hypothetical protein
MPQVKNRQLFKVRRERRGVGHDKPGDVFLVEHDVSKDMGPSTVTAYSGSLGSRGEALRLTEMLNQTYQAFLAGQQTFTMKTILELILRSFCIHENSYDYEDNSKGVGYRKTRQMSAIEACDGDELLGSIIDLFGHWMNDIQTFAAFYGLQIQHKGGEWVVADDVPPPPSPRHYWDNGKWNEPLPHKPSETAT